MTETPNLRLVTGDLFEENSAQSHPAELVDTDGALTLRSDGKTTYVDRHDVLISDPLANIPRRITFPDGRVLVTRDHRAVAAIFAEHEKANLKTIVAWAEIFRPRIMIILATLFLASIFSLRFALPVAIDMASTMVPHSMEARLGSVAFGSFDLLLDDSELDKNRTQEVQALFDEIVAASRIDFPIDIHIRKGGFLKANAFALPGGPIIVTDELINLAPSDDALAGVLAHEIGHVEERHGLRRMMRAAGWVILVSVISEEAGGLFEEVAAFPTLLIDQAYSRSFETDADDRAMAIMEYTGRDPEAFAEMLGLITKDCGSACESAGWFSSHPAPSDRIERIQAHSFASD